MGVASAFWFCLCLHCLWAFRVWNLTTKFNLGCYLSGETLAERVGILESGFPELFKAGLGVTHPPSLPPFLC